MRRLDNRAQKHCRRCAVPVLFSRQSSPPDAREIVQIVGGMLRVDLIVRNIGREPMPETISVSSR
jgi:hypothetical protein